MNNLQRIYDAMLIKAFRKDITLGMLSVWLKPYNITVPDPRLKRQPQYTKIRVQTFVGHYLKPLADRLWDTDPKHDIKTLDWIKDLDVFDRSRTLHNEINKFRYEDKVSKGRTYVIKGMDYVTHRSNQWNVTKQTGKSSHGRGIK